MGAALLAAAVLGGIVAWSLAEYLLHRCAMHVMRGRGVMSRAHLEHHARPAWRWSAIDLLSWAGIVAAALGAWLPLGWWLGGLGAGGALAAGWVAGYASYEYLHASAHRRAPRTAYGAWLRRHHLHHHFGHPMANHGVTSPLWDLVFGTFEAPPTVRVPRRLAPAWLLDEQGRRRPDMGAYVLVGRDVDVDDERVRALDRARAFASLAPPD